MIERKFTKHNVTEGKIQEYVLGALGRAGIGAIKLQLTPLGEKIVVFSSNPGLVVGKEGSNIKELTAALKRNFNLENPQIEISEVQDPNTNAKIVADKIAGALERFGSGNFKGIMHKAIGDIMYSGARGVEIVLSGKIPGSRAKKWRILSGYMKKCGDVAITSVQSAIASAQLKSGTIGVKVKIMPSDIVLPDTVKILDQPKEEKKEAAPVEDAKKEEVKEEKKKAEKPKKPRKKKNDKEIKNAGGAEQAGTEQ